MEMNPHLKVQLQQMGVTVCPSYCLMSSVVTEAISRAYGGVFDGDRMTPYISNCRFFHPMSGSVVCFTRDVGHHKSGWWKNPDYERCFHLSLSFLDPIIGENAPKNNKLTMQWVDLFYGDSKRLVWAESPVSKKGKASDVWHYRVFCDEHWRPMKPRGEVYGKELTKAGWKSFSEVQAEMTLAEAQEKERMGNAE